MMGTVFTLFALVQAHAEVCGPWLTDVPVGVRMSRSVDHVADITTLNFVDEAAPRYRATASRVGQLVQFKFHLRDGTARAPALHGRDVIRLALADFEPRARVIDVGWIADDEIRVVNAGERAGLSTARAAERTWTARTLARFGYGVLDVGPVLGEAGRRTLVLCTFRKPSRAWWRWIL